MTKILITPLYGIGDSLLITPAIKILKENLPKAELTLLTFNKGIYEILKSNIYIDNLLFYPFLKKDPISSVLYILRNFSFKFDVTINFYPSNRRDYNIFSFLTFSPLRIGHHYKNDNFRELNWLKNRTIKEDTLLHCVEENIHLLKLLGISITNKNIPNLEIFLDEQELNQGRLFIDKNIKRYKNKLIGIHPGSSKFKNHTNRRLPKEKFLELTNTLDDFYFFIFSGEDEKDEADFIYSNSKSNNVIKVEGKSIREVASIMKYLNIFVSNDSGLMHLAATMGIPVVGIFGPTNPNWIHPWGVKYQIVQTNLECSPCFYYSPRPLECKLREKFKCLREISVEKIIAAIYKLL